MTSEPTPKSDIPVLTDIVSPEEAASLEEMTASHSQDSLIAELQTRLSSSAYGLTEQALRNAFADMEATLLEQISARLRKELPELIDRILREHLDENAGEA